MALAWILRSLEGVEATIIGWSEVNRRRSAAFQGPRPLLLPEAWFPGSLVSAGASRPPRSRLLLTRPPAAAPPFHTTGLWPVHSTDHRPESKDS